MATPAQIYPILEGLAGVVPATGTQVVGDWIVALKQILRGAPHRNYTDYAFQALSDIDEDGAVETNVAPLTTGTAIYGLLVGTVSTDAQRDWVVVADADTLTFAGELAYDNAVVAALQLAAAGTGLESFEAMVWPAGIPLATGLTICADGRDGTGPAGNDIRGWVLYRSTAY